MKPWDSPAIGTLAQPRAPSRRDARAGPGRARSVLAALGLAAQTVAGMVAAVVALAPLALRRPGRRAATVPAGTPAGGDVLPAEVVDAAPPER